MKTKITDKIVAQTEWSGNTVIVRDTEVRGFFLSVGKAKKSFKVQWDTKTPNGRKSNRRTLGSTDDLNTSQARALARKRLEQNDGEFSSIEAAQNSPTLEEILVAVLEEKGLRTGKRYLRAKLRTLHRLMPSWAGQQAISITELKVSEIHQDISRNVSESAANTAVRLLLFIKSNDRHGHLPNLRPNFLKRLLRTSPSEYSTTNVIEVKDLPAWLGKLRRLLNPLRQEMHLFCLYSGLRPSLVARIKKEWIELACGQTSFPAEATAMRQDFTYFLSTQQIEILNKVLRIHAMFGLDSPLLFPSKKCGHSIPSITREPTMPGQTGHVLRNTYWNTARNLGHDSDTIRALLDYRAQSRFQPTLEGQKDLAKGIQQEISDQIDIFLLAG